MTTIANNIIQRTNYATGAKRGKTGNRCQARENMQPAPSAGKYTTGAKRGKTGNRRQARENAYETIHDIFGLLFLIGLIELISSTIENDR